jgi:BolA protein
VTSTEAQLRQVLKALNPTQLTIVDNSIEHAGHAGNKGGSHFTISIVSDLFEGLPLIKRHRLVNQAAAELLRHEIHALSIKAQTIAEYESGLN